MITKEQYEAAISSRDAAEKTINEYHSCELKNGDDRIVAFETGFAPFSEDELRFAAGARCECCGAGLAYPKDISVGLKGQWYCSLHLQNKGKPDCKNSQYPFAFYEIKSDDQPSAMGHTTRPKKEVDK